MMSNSGLALDSVEAVKSLPAPTNGSWWRDAPAARWEQLAAGLLEPVESASTVAAISNGHQASVAGCATMPTMRASTVRYTSSVGVGARKRASQRTCERRLYRDLHLARFDPFHGPDWRWQLAVELSTKKRRLFDDVDPCFCAAVRFIRALQGGKREGVLRRQFPAVFAAQEIYAADDMQRCEIEARLLAGEREGIAETVGIAPQILSAYIHLFFDVADSLHARDWIVLHAVKFFPGEGACPDERAIWRYAGWYLPWALDTLIADYRAPNPLQDAAGHQLAQRIRLGIRWDCTATSDFASKGHLKALLSDARVRAIEAPTVALAELIGSLEHLQTLSRLQSGAKGRAKRRFKEVSSEQPPFFERHGLSGPSDAEKSPKCWANLSTIATGSTLRWKIRGGRKYLYAAYRDAGGKMREKYLGKGCRAVLAAARDRQARAARQKARQEEVAAKALQGELTAQTRALDQGIELLFEAELRSRGFHKHAGTWRKKRAT